MRRIQQSCLLPLALRMGMYTTEWNAISADQRGVELCTANMNWPAVLLFLVSLSSLSSENACVNVTGCNGCGTSTISCSAAGLTEFPRFSAVDTALVGKLSVSTALRNSIWSS